MGNYKTCDILKTTGRRAKRTKFGPHGKAFSVYGVLLTVKCLFKFSLGSLGGFPIFPIFDDLVSRKRLLVE